MDRQVLAISAPPLQTGSQSPQNAFKSRPLHHKARLRYPSRMGDIISFEDRTITRTPMGLEDFPGYGAREAIERYLIEAAHKAPSDPKDRAEHMLVWLWMETDFKVVRTDFGLRKPR